MNTGDTVVAISSAVGSAARMIVRLSGSDAASMGASVSPVKTPTGDTAERCDVSFRGLRVPAWIYFFKAPRSYTGEDIVEFHIPGNPLLARMLLDELVSRGARHAEPGEFTARAYFNGRIDLSEAEGVAATIAAQSERELRAARQLLSGELSRRLRPILNLLVDSLALVEVGIDFSEEDVSFLSHAELNDRISRSLRELEKLLFDSTRIETLAHEPRIVLVGRPNAGKSTLLNTLAGDDRAVVSSEAGTTRDAIWSHVRLRRGLVRMVDVAGLTDETESLNDLEHKMRQSALRTIQSADRVVLVIDITDTRRPLPLPVEADLTVLTKLDLAGSSGEFAVSARTGQNIDRLRERLDTLAFGQATGGAALALNARHVEAIHQAEQALARASEALNTTGAPEVVAMELREAVDALGTILGAVAPDDVLGRIFSSFCIGK